MIFGMMKKNRIVDKLGSIPLNAKENSVKKPRGVSFAPEQSKSWDFFEVQNLQQLVEKAFRQAKECVLYVPYKVI